VLNRRSQSDSLRQGILQGDFSGLRFTEAIRAKLAQLPQRPAANSLLLEGREFLALAQGTLRRRQGIREVG